MRQIHTNIMITEADEQNPLNFGSNVGHKVSIIIFLEITTLYTNIFFLFTDATEPSKRAAFATRTGVLFSGVCIIYSFFM